MSGSFNALFNLVLSIYVLVCVVRSMYTITKIETFSAYPTFFYLFLRNCITFPLELGNREGNDIKFIANFELCIYFICFIYG